MELVLIALLEALGALTVQVLIPLVTLILELLVGLVLLVVEAYALWRRHRASPCTVVAPPQPVDTVVAAPQRVASGGGRRRPFRRSRIVFALVLGVTALGFVLASTIFFEPLARMGLARMEERSGVHVEFDSASGNLLFGTATVTGIVLSRTGHARTNFTLTAQEVSLDVAVWSFLSGTPRLEELLVRSVRGSVAQSRIGAEPSGEGRDFMVDSLHARDVELEWTVERDGRTRAATKVRLDTLDTAPFSKRWAAFDVLFRSNIRGSLGDAPFEIQMAGSDAGRKTAWTATRVPVALLGDLLGGPAGWLDSGSLDIAVTDAWEAEPSREVTLHWKLLFDDVHAVVPPELTGIKGTVATSVVRHVNARGKSLAVEFDLHLDADRLQWSTSVDAAAVWHAAADAFARGLATQAGLSPDVVRGLGARGLTVLKERWLRRKNGSAEKPGALDGSNSR